MACKRKDADMEGLSEIQKKILGTLNNLGKPMAPKQIAEAAGMESKEMSANIKVLKKLGYIDSPVRCKYAITNDGKVKL